MKNLKQNKNKLRSADPSFAVFKKKVEGFSVPRVHACVRAYSRH